MKEKASDWYRRCPDQNFDVEAIEEDLVAITQPYLDAMGWTQAGEGEDLQDGNDDAGDLSYFNEPQSDDEDVEEKGNLECTNCKRDLSIL